MSSVESNNWPTRENLYRLLDPWVGKSAFVVSMSDGAGRALGNNGDFLMHWVFERMLEELRITKVKSASDADVVIVPPNGALLEVYQFPRLLASQIKDFRSVPLVIFPSSALFESVDPSFIFEGRSAPTLWILRERFSYAKLRSRWGESLAARGVRLELDHDVVASGNEFVRELFSTQRSNRGDGRLLVAARTDIEARSLSNVVAGGSAKPGSSKSLAREVFFRLPASVRTRVARIVFHRRARLAGGQLRLVAESALRNLDFHIHGNPTYVDASATEYATFAQYLALLNRSSAVVTNRLHVALPAAIIGRQVVIVEAGYHKLQGVFDQSLSAVENVRLVVDRPEA